MLSIKIKDGQIAEEKLIVDGHLRLHRDADGRGAMWAEKISQNLEFKVPKNALVLFNRRDEVQHSYLEPLFAWASSVRKYSFGTEFGKQIVWAAPMNTIETASDQPASAIDPNRVVELYAEGYMKFGEKFDKAILKDFAAVGYDCESIECHPLDGSDFKVEFAPIGARVHMALSVKECDLAAPTRQHEMSMGMYRALALIINLNFTIFNKQESSIFVDDIGEGLDFERSLALIKLLIKKCNRKNFQLTMATNDRFVMNEVDLKFWHIVHRTGSHLKILDYQNSPKLFDEFKFLGLSNFDFFRQQAYLEKVR